MELKSLIVALLGLTIIVGCEDEENPPTDNGNEAEESKVAEDWNLSEESEWDLGIQSHTGGMGRCSTSRRGPNRRRLSDGGQHGGDLAFESPRQGARFGGQGSEERRKPTVELGGSEVSLDDTEGGAPVSLPSVIMERCPSTRAVWYGGGN